MQEASRNTLVENNTDILRVSFDTNSWLVSLDISAWIFGLVALIAIIWIWNVRKKTKRYKLVKLNISLGKFGTAEFKPNEKDIQIAHKIWTELVTRKVAIPIDPKHDVIVEVYDSWYILFTKVRELISEIPADLLRSEASTRELVRISTSTLNKGLRPHLTLWQAKFRNWYDAHSEELKQSTPQELQRKYPEYDALIADMTSLNDEFIKYASELKKIVDGEHT